MPLGTPGGALSSGELMYRVARKHLLTPSGRMLILLGAIGVTGCDSTNPSSGGSAGGLALVTTTAGIQPDGDGYTIMVDGEAHGTIGANDSLAVPDVGEGAHAVELSGIQFNCATLGQFSRTVSVRSDAGAVVDYSVACDAFSRSRIAFVRDQDFDPKVMVMNADGSDVVSLTNSLGAIYPFTGRPPVSWSADGNRVAFTRADGGLYATTGEGSGVIQLAPAGRSPSWSDDGRKVAFLADRNEHGSCCLNIYVAESDGSAVTPVTDGSTLHSHYDFAANGSLLAYTGDEATPRSLTLVRPDGTGQRELPPPPDLCCPQQPSLSPDGQWVAYVAHPEAQGDDGPGWEIYVSPTDGSGPATNVSNNTPGDDWFAVWSPDGTRIAFVSSIPGQFFSRGSVHVVNADGTGQISLGPPDFIVFEPAWSPDGTRIAYSGVVGVEAHVFVANADGSGRTDVTPNLFASRPTWTGR